MTRQELESFRSYVHPHTDRYPWILPREITLNPRWVLELVELALGIRRLEDEESAP